MVDQELGNIRTYNYNYYDYSFTSSGTRHQTFTSRKTGFTPNLLSANLVQKSAN